jgi:hypothetical protein
MVGLLPAIGRAAQPAPQRIVVLDALALPPSFQKANVAARVEQGVAAAIRAHGWEPIPIETDCRDLGCAGAVAGAAKTLYVLILVGRYVATDTYATDVGVSLWRDGSVIASRSENDEEAERGKPAGGTVLRCGPPDGTCTPDLLMTKLQQYAAKILEDETAALRARAAAAVPAPLQVAGPPSPVLLATPSGEDRSRRAWGWSLVGAGALLAGGAIALWAFNGAKTHCNPVVGDPDDCRYEWRTTTAAAITGGAAVAALAGGTAILLFDGNSSRLALSLHPSGVGLGGRF